MSNLIIGTAGHIDHGKTELIKALTGIDTDRLKDEKDRGISIDLGFARFPLEKKGLMLGVVDVPGHEAFIRNMLAGVTGVDLVLFVIAADEGVMPQTREHLDILRYLEVKQGVLVITKADLVEEEWLELVAEDASELLRGTFMESAPVVVTSTKTGEGLEELKEKLLEVADGIEARPEEDLFRLPIDRVFTIKGMGTVITGTVWSGSVKLDQAVTIYPVGKNARVKGIQVHSDNAERVGAGTRVALALSGLSRWEIQRGSTALLMSDWKPTMMIEAHLNYLTDATRSLKNRTRIRFHLATQEVMGRIVILEGGEMAGGESGFVQIRLEKPVVTRKGDHFVIRSYSPLATIGGGTVLVTYPQKRTTLDSAESKHLDILRTASTEEIIKSLVSYHGMSGYPSDLLPIDAGDSPELVYGILKKFCSSKEIFEIKGDLFHNEAVRKMYDKVLDGLDRYHRENPLQQGVNREELRHRIKGVYSVKLLEDVLNRLIKERKIEVSGGGVKLSSHEIVFQDGAGTMVDAIQSMLKEELLSPPDIGKISSELGVDRKKCLELLSALQKTGKIVKVDDNIWVVSEGIELARDKIKDFIEKRGKAKASELREHLGVSRKYAIPILEYMDRIRVTYRKGDHRFLVH
jgi:selenocysteine-specific elongation factor